MCGSVPGNDKYYYPPSDPQYSRYLSQWSSHSVHKLCCEVRRLPAAGLVDDPLAAGQVGLEAAAEDGHLLV